MQTQRNVEEKLAFIPNARIRQDGRKERGVGKRRTLELKVLSLSGTLVAVLEVVSTETVREVKERLRCITGATTNQQQLVYGRKLLKDSRKLIHCGMKPPEATVQLVLIHCASGISRYLEVMFAAGAVDNGKGIDALEASLADIVDSVLQSEHRLSQRCRPNPADLTRLGGGAPDPRRRAELIKWMLEAFDILQFDDAMLHAVVLTLDRFYVKTQSPMDDSSLQRVLLSAVCTELKTSNLEDEHHWKHVLLHLCQGRVALPTVLRTELEVLSRLDFVVSVPTPLCFLRGLSIRLLAEAEAPRWLGLACFLLELAMFDTDLEYGYPHVILAAAALGAALRVLAPTASFSKDLLENVAAYTPEADMESCARELHTCQEELLTLWLQCAAGVHELSPFYRPLQVKLTQRIGVTFPPSPEEALKNLHEVRCYEKMWCSATSSPFHCQRQPELPLVQ